MSYRVRLVVERVVPQRTIPNRNVAVEDKFALETSLTIVTEDVLDGMSRVRELLSQELEARIIARNRAMDRPRKTPFAELDQEEEQEDDEV